jgi:hypothetical protein
VAAGWGGWGRGGSASAPADPSEKDRREWLTKNGITPMNRSTRLWDMEITKHAFIPHTTEQVGSLDITRAQIAAQGRGERIEPLVWSGSRDMATGRAYDWCYCVEASRPDDDTIDGRVDCPCTCQDCKPGKGKRAVHWRKRNQDSRIHAAYSRRRWDEYYYERKLRIRLWRRLQALYVWWRAEDDLVEIEAELPERPTAKPAPLSDTPPVPDYEWPTVPLDIDEMAEDLDDDAERPDRWDWDGEPDD